ncbi:MAG: dihydrolipoyl dehydrogenase [Candidatus Glassbacteria bacterium]
MVVGEIRTVTDTLILGAGPGGYVAAIRASQLGREVTLVEREESPGGICLNHGCIPSKALIHAANFYHSTLHSEKMGIRAGSVGLDMKALQEWKRGVVNKLTDGVRKLLVGNGIQVVRGNLNFTDDHTARVETDGGVSILEFKNLVIASGSHPVELEELKFDGEGIISSRQALELEEVPDTLLVVGGGYIGLELGTVYAKLGSRVTVVELLDGLLPGTDTELVRVVDRRLKKLGVKVMLESRVAGCEKLPEGYRVDVQGKKGSSQLEASKILVTVGRKPNTSGFGLEKTGVELDDRGFIKVDNRMRTNVSHIYAIGDVAGEPLLAHKASKEAIVAVENIAGLSSAKDWLLIPSVIFTDPEIATAGMGEDEAKEKGYEVVIGKFPFAASGRALTMGEFDGFVKIVASEGDGRVLGVHIVGPDASNCISEAAIAIELTATLEDVALTVHPHPTLPESLMEAAEVALGRPIHILKRLS